MIAKDWTLFYMRAIQCFLLEVSKQPLLYWGSQNVLWSPALCTDRTMKCKVYFMMDSKGQRGNCIHNYWQWERIIHSTKQACRQVFYFILLQEGVMPMHLLWLSDCVLLKVKEKGVMLLLRLNHWRSKQGRDKKKNNSGSTGSQWH